MLRWIDSNHNVANIPQMHRNFFDNGRKKMSDSEYKEIKKYINNLIDTISQNRNGKTEFIVPGWIVGKTWTNTPLQILYDKIFIRDDESCALWYGLLMYETIIERPELWYCIKTKFNGRDFDQAIYWQQHNE